MVKAITDEAWLKSEVGLGSSSRAQLDIDCSVQPIKAVESIIADDLHIDAYDSDSSPTVRVLKSALKKARAGQTISVHDLVTRQHTTQLNEVKLLVDGEDIFEHGVFPVIESAKTSIHIAMFQLRAGKVGERLVNLLIEKAKQGVEVRVLVDCEGSRQFFGFASYNMLQRLAKEGVQQSENGPVQRAFVLRSPLFGSLSGKKKVHQKYIVVDSQVALVGATNMRDESRYKPSELGELGDRKSESIGAKTDHPIHDIMVHLKGDTVIDIQHRFALDWIYFGGTFYEETSEADTVKMLTSSASQESAATETGISKTEITVLQGMGDANMETIKVPLKLIKEAKRSIFLEAAYIASPEIQDALIEAARNGRDVTLIVPGKSDFMDLPNVAMENFFSKLLKSNGKIYIYPGRLHSKVLLVDEKTVCLGSASYMASPFQDLNLLICSQKFAKEIQRRLLKPDLEMATRFNQDKLQARPWYQRALSHLAQWVMRTAIRTSTLADHCTTAP